MALRGSRPRERVSGGEGAFVGTPELAPIGEKLDTGCREGVDVLRRDCAASAELPHRVSDRSQVAHDRRASVAEREREHSRRLDLAVRQDDEGGRGEKGGKLGVGQEAEPPVDRAIDSERRRELPHRLDGIERIAGDDEASIRNLAQDLRERRDEDVETLVSADEPEEEQRTPLGSEHRLLDR